MHVKETSSPLLSADSALPHTLLDFLSRYRSGFQIMDIYHAFRIPNSRKEPAQSMVMGVLSCLASPPTGVIFMISKLIAVSQLASYSYT
ncbi:hypothetical protein RchiOBHm_Chr7g0203151 [Rosa chinensis]|uniref:Uncharacterized protein n=1 Tax=Rosa chinensis TaxID=74649 RepID=A0A2P6P8E2_ROSCH|nr:hypothetical protein RchiOBHm_Chr7g0203151 [Rosa chinensis]